MSQFKEMVFERILKEKIIKIWKENEKYSEEIKENEMNMIGKD